MFIVTTSWTGIPWRSKSNLPARLGIHGDLVTDRGRQVDSIMEAVVNGSKDAFGELYDEVAGSVYGLVRRIVRDPSISEEVTHDVLVEVWAKAATWDPERGSALAWISTISRRRAVDRVRSEQSARVRLEAHGALQSPPADVVSEEVIEAEERGRVRSVLVGLSDVQRQVIELAYYEGHTQQEIAGMLEVPLGTVKTRMRDGMMRIKARMGQV